MKNISKVYIGVDISKDNLDIYIHPLEKFFKIANSDIAIKKFIKDLAQYNVIQIAYEATGGYEKLLAQLLKNSHYYLWVVDPRRIKGFIIASGCKSKTDKIDARKIAEFASKHSPEYEIISKTENQNKLQALVNRKNDLVKFLIAEKTRFKHPSHVLYASNIKKFIKILEHEIKLIDLQMQDLIQKDEDLNKKSNFLQSIPGIGKASAVTLLAFVPEIGQIENSKISALIGVALMNMKVVVIKGKNLFGAEGLFQEICSICVH